MLGWLRSRRAALGELAAAACGSNGAGKLWTRGGTGGAGVGDHQHPHPGGASARLLFSRIEESFRAFGIVCGALVSAQPGVAHGGFDVPASPLDPALLVSLAGQRAAFCLSTTAALGCALLSLAHLATARAMLAAQRGAAAEALHRLAELQRIGTPGATALAANLAAPTRGAFL